jgi:hypothetical protein
MWIINQELDEARAYQSVTAARSKRLILELIQAELKAAEILISVAETLTRRASGINPSAGVARTRSAKTNDKQRESDVVCSHEGR